MELSGITYTVYTGYSFTWRKKKKEVILQESVVTTESFLLIKSNWQQLQRRIIIHRAICQENTTYWHTLEKKKPKNKDRQLLYVSEGGVVFVFLFKLYTNST